MSVYHAEGFIKEVTVCETNECKVSFTLEPSAPYLFEKKTDDGKVERCLLFVDNSKTFSRAMIVDGSVKFLPPKKCALCAILIAKSNHSRVRVEFKSANRLFRIVSLTGFGVI